jgi:hypothetical protein
MSASSPLLFKVTLPTSGSMYIPIQIANVHILICVAPMRASHDPVIKSVHSLPGLQWMYMSRVNYTVHEHEQDVDICTLFTFIYVHATDWSHFDILF